MPVMDEFKEERELMKNRPFKAKLHYFWDYYKWHTFAVVVIIAVLISIIHNYMTRKEQVLIVEVINGVSSNQEELFISGLNERLEIDTKEQEVRVGTDMHIEEEVYDQATAENMQRLLVYVAAGDLDMIASESKTFLKYGYLDTFLDLRTCLSSAQIEKYSDSFYYVDAAVIRKLDELHAQGDYNATVTYPDPLRPEAMEEPVPVAIRMSDLWGAKYVYEFNGAEPVIGIIQNAKHVEESIRFIDALDAFIPEGDVIIPGMGVVYTEESIRQDLQDR